jgi:molybdate transport system substrate-binding protein
MIRTFGALLGVLGAAALIAGCADPETATSESSGDDGVKTGAITVFAAASLKSTFTELGKRFEDANPGTKVNFNFGGSSDLVTQLTQGAPADVFASADTNNMTKAVDAGLVHGDPVAFATNTLTIVTTPGNPKGITSFADLAEPGISVVVCAPQVPCGSATEKIEKSTGVTLSPVSEESAVTDVLGKVTSGQADAGLVYVTDAKGAGDAVTAIAFPESAGAVNSYPIATLTSSENVEAAQQFVDLVVSSEGRKALSEAGFTTP